MSTEWTFEYDPQHTPALENNKFSLQIDVEIKYFNREEFEVSWKAYGDNDEEVTSQLAIWDKGLIEAKAWDPPQHILTDAYQDYENSRQPQYDKYADYN